MPVSELEVLDGIELIPGRIPELDDEIKATLARLILDETIELPSSERGNRYSYGHLTDEGFIELYEPLIKVLGLDPAVDKPPLREYIDRASKLGLTPSVRPVYSRMSLGRLHTGLGFRSKFRFVDSSKTELVESGKRLARFIGGRPTREVVTLAGRGELGGFHEEFPTIDDIKSRFKRLGVFHELIGYPTSRGWDEEDHLDWTSAFYRQNPDRQLTASLLDYFSKAGKGPSRQPVLTVFGSINKYKQRSEEEFQYIVDEEERAKNQRLDQAQELAAYDEVLLDLLGVIPEEERTRERILQVTAQYVLGKRLATLIDSPAPLRAGALIKSPDAFVRWCVNNSGGVHTVAGIETHASALGVFDDLWPMYRFQNVDLRLKS